MLERELQGMGGGLQVKQEGGVNDDEIVEVGEVVVDEKDEERRANPGVKREEEEEGGTTWAPTARAVTPSERLPAGRWGGRQTGSTADVVGSSLPAGRRACHLAGTRTPPSFDLAPAAA